MGKSLLSLIIQNVDFTQILNFNIFETIMREISKNKKQKLNIYDKTKPDWYKF
jgi:hypothetical protein